MGLDMYLDAKRYFWRQEDTAVSDGIKMALGFMFNMEVKEVTMRAGYWRKANQIHKWFVDNVQDGEDECNPHDVGREQLQQLRDVCQSVLDITDPEQRQALAEEVLPTSSGCFYGSTDYDEWYYKDLEDTIKIIDQCLRLGTEWSFTYRSSW